MARSRRVGRPSKKSSGGASVQEYREKRKRLASRLDYAGEKSGLDMKAVAMPEVPKVISPGSIRKLDRLMDKLSEALGKSKLGQFFKQKARQKSKKKEKMTQEDKTQTDQTDSSEEPELDEIVIEQYEDFIKLAENYMYAESMFYQNSPQGSFSSGMYNEIQDHVANCLAMLSRIGAYDDTHKRSVILNLMNSVSQVYDKTEEYLYYYKCYSDEAYGASVLQAVEDILTEQTTGHGLTEELKKSYADILSSYGYDPEYEIFDV